MVHLASGRWHWLGWILDGAGEAKIDLLPGSRFLTDLNARPHPPGVKLSIIAGVMGHLDETEIRRVVELLETNLPGDKQNLAQELKGWAENTARELGDGLVGVDSALLRGIPHQIVPGTHLSIIRNVLKDSRRVPPAVPIILEKINRQ